MITDQLIVGCDDEKVRLHLCERQATTSREALAIAVAYKAALRYNETLRDNSAVIASTGYSNRGEGNGRRGYNDIGRREASARSYRGYSNFNNHQGSYGRAVEHPYTYEGYTGKEDLQEEDTQTEEISQQIIIRHSITLA